MVGVDGGVDVDVGVVGYFLCGCIMFFCLWYCGDWVWWVIMVLVSFE